MMLIIIISGAIILVAILASIAALAVGRNKENDLEGDLWQRRWSEIEHYLQSTSPAEWRLAVIEGDKFLDGILKHKGMGGMNMGERLKIAQARFVNLKSVWPAHILRNKLVHENDFKLSQSQAKKAVDSFYQAARIFGFKK